MDRGGGSKRFIEQKEVGGVSIQEAARFRRPGGPADQASLVLRVQGGQCTFPPLWGGVGGGMGSGCSGNNRTKWAIVAARIQEWLREERVVGKVYRSSVELEYVPARNLRHVRASAVVSGA